MNDKFRVYMQFFLLLFFYNIYSKFYSINYYDDYTVRHSQHPRYFLNKKNIYIYRGVYPQHHHFISLVCQYRYILSL